MLFKGNNSKAGLLFIKGVVILMATVFVGCTHIKVPEEAYYRQVLDMPYTDEFDCKAKAKLYWRRLKEKGHDAKIVIGIIDGQGHCWVEYTEDGVTRLIEPTIKEMPSGYLRDGYHDYKADFYFDAKEGADFILKDRN